LLNLLTALSIIIAVRVEQVVAIRVLAIISAGLAEPNWALIAIIDVGITVKLDVVNKRRVHIAGDAVSFFLFRC